MKWKIALSVGTLVLVFGGLAGIKALQIVTMVKAGEAMGPQPTTVQVKAVERGLWEQSLPTVGSVSAINGTTIRSEAEGIVREILFEPGTEVSAGDILVQLDTEVEEAQLEVSLARLRLAEAELKRARELHARQAVSDADLDAALASFDSAQATVANLQAVIAKRSIRAPFSGSVGVRHISLGNYIGRGDPIVDIQALDEVYLNFTLPQADLGKLSQGMVVRGTTDAWPEVNFEGSLTAIDPAVNEINRALGLQATFQNDGGQLRPGMFMNVEVVRAEKKPVTMIPRSAVLNATFGDTVFVVEEAAEGSGPRVRQQIVRLGESRGDYVEVLKGLEGTEKVVTAGGFKLRDGALITPSDRGTVEPELDPEPQES